MFQVILNRLLQKLKKAKKFIELTKDQNELVLFDRISRKVSTFLLNFLNYFKNSITVQKLADGNRVGSIINSNNFRQF